MRTWEVSWAGAWARTFEASKGGQSFCGPSTLIGLAHGSPHPVAFRFAGGSTRRVILHQGHLQVIPAGIGHDVEWPDCSFTLVGIDNDLLADARLYGLGALPHGGEPRLQLRNPLIEALLMSLAKEAREYAASPSPWRSLYRDSLARALVQELLHGAPTSQGRGVISGKERLAPTRLRQILDFIETNLSEPLDLRRLADASGRSPFHFARAFKATVGQSPVRYVAARRLQRAVDLIALGRQPVETIAHECGFDSAESMRRALRRSRMLSR